MPELEGHPRIAGSTWVARAHARDRRPRLLRDVPPGGNDGKVCAIGDRISFQKMRRLLLRPSRTAQTFASGRVPPAARFAPNINNTYNKLDHPLLLRDGTAWREAGELLNSSLFIDGGLRKARQGAGENNNTHSFLKYDRAAPKCSRLSSQSGRVGAKVQEEQMLHPLLCMRTRRR